MQLGYQVLAAFGLDMLLGDPRWLPHPVRGIGLLAGYAEAFYRRVIPQPRVAGVFTALSVVGVVAGLTWLAVMLARRLHPVGGDIVSVIVIYTTIAARDLAHHSRKVYRSLAQGDIVEARRRVSMIVGRDTAHLDEPEIVRAAVESVAESIVDGVTAPLFFALLGGPVVAMAYRTVNTLDSMFGHKNERYLRFGWASARLDDVANFIPARLTQPMIWLAALLLGGRAANAIKISRRDSHRHPSPNAGHAEAAVAGALGVQLGGLNYYEGEALPKETIGDPLEPLTPAKILQANRLMFVAVSLFLLLGVMLLWTEHMWMM